MHEHSIEVFLVSNCLPLSDPREYEEHPEVYSKN